MKVLYHLLHHFCLYCISKGLLFKSAIQELSNLVSDIMIISGLSFTMSLKTFDLFRKELIFRWPTSIRLIISPINLDLMQTFIWVTIFLGNSYTFNISFISGCWTYWITVSDLFSLTVTGFNPLSANIALI